MMKTSLSPLSFDEDDILDHPSIDRLPILHKEETIHKMTSF